MSDENKPVSDQNLSFSDLGPAKVKRNWGALITLVLVLIAGVAGVIYYFFFTVSTRPHRVLLVLEAQTSDGTRYYWWSGEKDPVSEGLMNALTVTVHKEMHDLEFDILDIRKKEVKNAFKKAKSLDDLKAAAIELEIGHLVHGKIRVVDKYEITNSPEKYYTIEADWHVVDTQTGDTKAVFKGKPLRLTATGRTEEDALLEVGGAIADLGMPHMFMALEEMPRIQQMKDKDARTSLDYETQKAASRLEVFFTGVEEDRKDLKRFKAREGKVQSAFDRYQAASKPSTIVGRLHDRNSFFGSLPDGRIVWMREPHRPYKSESSHSPYRFAVGHEELIVSDQDGGNEKVLLRRFAFYNNYGDVSRDGKHVAVSIDYENWSKSLAIVSTEDGSVHEIDQHPKRYYFRMQFSPDGSRLSYVERLGRRSSVRRVLVAPVKGGESSTIFDGDFRDISKPRWSFDGSHLYFAIQPDRYSSYNLWRFDPDGNGIPTPILGPKAAPPPPPPPPEPDPPEEGVVPDGEATTDGSDPDGVVLDADGNPIIEPEPEPEPVLPDNRYTSSFPDVEVGPHGKFLYVAEVAGYDDTFLGRFDLATGEYERLLGASFESMEISPDGQHIALLTRSFDDPNDGDRGDIEVLIVPTDPIKSLEAFQVTNNDADDYMRGWSSDSKSVFVTTLLGKRGRYEGFASKRRRSLRRGGDDYLHAALSDRHHREVMSGSSR